PPQLLPLDSHAHNNKKVGETPTQKVLFEYRFRRLVNQWVNCGFCLAVVAGFSPRSGMGTKHHRLPRECYQGQVSVAFTVCIADRKHLFTNSHVVGILVSFLKEVAEEH